MCVSGGHLWNGASRWGMAGFDVVSCHCCASREGACGIEPLDGELVLMLCAATDVRLQWALVESSI